MSAPSTLRAPSLPLPVIRSHEPFRRCSTAIAFVLSLLLVTPAFAAPPSQRVLEAFKDRLVEVSRDDRRVVEGKLVAIDESSIVIVTDDGAEVMVPRGKIESIRAVPAAATPPATRSEERRAPDPTDPEAKRVHVHIESPESRVQVRADDEETGEEERVVCSSPCDQAIDARPGRELQLAHRGVSIGPPLDLQGHGTSVNITVDRLPSRAQFVFGLILLGVGAASIPAGAGMAVTGNDARPVLGSRVDTQVNVGHGLIVFGSALVPAGIVLAVLGRGSYTIEDREPSKAAGWPLSPFAAPIAYSTPASLQAFTGLTAGLVGQF